MPSRLVSGAPWHGCALITKSGDTGMSSFNRFSLRTARLDGTDVYQIDNLTIGSTFADVVPEPARMGDRPARRVRPHHAWLPRAVVR